MCIERNRDTFVLGLGKKLPWRCVGDCRACNLSCQILLHLPYRESGFSSFTDNAALLGLRALRLPKRCPFANASGVLETYNAGGKPIDLT
jgi:hypothetical protein